MNFRTVPSPTPYGVLFLKIGGLQPHPNLQLLLYQEWVKLRTSIWLEHSQGPSEHKPIKYFGEKGVC